MNKFRLSLLLLTTFLSATAVFAGQPIVWEIGSRAELLKGEARGVSITDTGVVTLAPNASESFNTEQAYVWSSAVDSAGNVYLGTGHDGKLFRIGADGKGALLYKAAELDVTALAVSADGSLFAATSPDGKVYRVTADGKADVYFDPADKYIWSLAILKDGSLAVGTGDNGKLYRVRTAGAKPESSLLIDTNQTHVMSLAVTSQGDLFAGTDPGGLVSAHLADGKAFAVHDASLREIHALAPAPDGSIYALALGDAASTTKAGTGTTTDAATVTATVTSTVTAADESGAAAQTTTVRSRGDLSTARSAVVHILPDGGADVVWSSSTVTGFSILATKGGVLIGTSDKGRIYLATDDGRDTLLLQSTEAQISSLVARGSDIFAASSNQGKLVRFGGAAVKEGSYESPVRDAKLVSAWGRIWWRGSGPIELQTRSGNSERPDTTWSDWSVAYTDATGPKSQSLRPGSFNGERFCG
jgi:WD40 repeat protein